MTNAAAPAPTPSRSRRSGYGRLLLVILAVAATACHHKPHRTTADGLPLSSKANATGDGLTTN